MNIWIVTIGSSDVQLDSDAKNREKARNEKQRSDKVWSYWYEEDIKEVCNDIAFEPKQLYRDFNESYRIAARVLGTVYQFSSSEIQEEIWKYLNFPLLNSFSTKLTGKATPNKILIILTDQEMVFDKKDKDLKKCPYWQDTCTLQPILEKYLKVKFPNAQLDYIYLKPKFKAEGLDNWDKALKLLQQELASSELNETATIFVSHQAGTPAISSAVQFVSLSKFGKKVEFLVSNEYEQKPADIIKSSTYLQGMKVQEAKALLKRYDYLGVERILKHYLKDASDPLLLEIRDLLAMAMQWNFAKFEDFGNARGEVAKERKNQWWWMGYEAAYLGVVRLRQGNTVEALFHSFRAVEGLIKEWALDKCKPQIKYSNSKQPNTAYIHDLNLPNNLRHWFDSNKNRDYNNVGLFGKDLFTLLEVSHSQNEWNQNSDIQVVVGNTIEERNATFHCLRGLDEKEVFQAWKTDSKEKWETRVLGCLNFVSKQKFVSLKSASLMAKVHDELVDAIAQYELKS